MRAIRQQMRSTAGRELSVVQFRTLAFLDRHPGASLSDVKDHIGLTLPSVSKLVQGLLARGFLHRADDPADRRRNVIVATAKGRRVLEAARAVTRQSLARRLGALADEEVDAVSRALRTLRPIFATDGWPSAESGGRASAADPVAGGATGGAKARRGPDSRTAAGATPQQPRAASRV